MLNKILVVFISIIASKALNNCTYRGVLTIKRISVKRSMIPLNLFSYPEVQYDLFYKEDLFDKNGKRTSTSSQPLIGKFTLKENIPEDIFKKV